MLGRLTTLAGCLLLASCATPELVPVLKAICVPESQLKGYTLLEKAKAKIELNKLGPDSVVGQMLMDYSALQTADRACLRGGR